MGTMDKELRCFTCKGCKYSIKKFETKFNYSVQTQNKICSIS
jgi:hypothetical protein